MKAKRLDHVGLAVSNVDAALAFYSECLGLAPVRVDEFRSGRAPYPGVQLGPDLVLDLIPTARPEAAGRVNHLAIEVEPTELADVARQLREQGYTVESDIAQRPGARGTGVALVVHDPDGRRVELRYYPSKPR